MAYRRRRFNRRRRRPGYVGVRRRRIQRGYQVAYVNERPRAFLRAFTKPFPRMLSYNPQFLKVKRSFQYTGPANDGAVWPGYNAVTGESDITLNSSTTNVSAFKSFSYQFKISDIPQVSEFGNLFDQYRIVGIKITFKYMNATSVDPQYTANYNSPLIHLAVCSDYDDIATYAQSAAGWQEITETGRQKVGTFPNQRGNSISHFFVPRNQIKTLDVTGGNTGIETVSKRWLDGATALDATYYGVKGLVYANPTTTAIQHHFRVYCTYYTQWKNRK